MIALNDFKDPFDAITVFESAVAKYTGARYCVATDCCTHAIELALRYVKPDIAIIPKHTYLSIPMVLEKLDVPYEFVDWDWEKEYQLRTTPVWDSARCFEPDMYFPGRFQCLSFGRTKPLEIGRGGAVLTDDVDAYNWLKRAAYDGRDLQCTPWEEQEIFQVGYHYMMRPEECVVGLNKLANNEINTNQEYWYPDLSKLIIER